MGLKFAKRNNLLGDIVDFYIPNPKCENGICVGATDLCKKYCYGNGVFRHSKDPRKKMLNTEAIARENYRITKTDSFEEEMNSLIEKTLNLTRLRIHSIGDFYDYEYFLKWMRVIEKNPSIQFTAYVKNFDVLIDYKNDNGVVYDNFNVLLSVYPDTYDKYENEGGKDYIDSLFADLELYYKAKKYVVCSREYFRQEIKKHNGSKFFCNGGTEMLLEWDESLKDQDFSELFTPGEPCYKCLKCYSTEKCPAGSSIYAVLRASSKLADIQGVLKRSDEGQYKILKSLYPKEI